MEIFVDDQPLAGDLPEDATIRQALDLAVARAQADGRIIAEVRRDGVTLDTNDLDNALSQPARDCARLDFTTGSAADLTSQALMQAKGMLQELDDARNEAVDKLNQGQVSDAMAKLGPFFDSWRQAYEVVLQSAQLLRIDLTAETVEGTPVAEVLGEFAEQLRQLKEALEAQDHVTVADILTYEVDETNRRLTGLIDLVIRLGEDQGSNA